VLSIIRCSWVQYSSGKDASGRGKRMLDVLQLDFLEVQGIAMYFFPAWLWRILELLQVVLSPTFYMYDQLWYVVSTVRSFASSSKGKVEILQ